MTSSPTERRYMAQLEQALAGTSLSEKERREILLEVEGHFSEARASGAPIDDVMSKFGPAQQLARAYATELLTPPFRITEAKWAYWLFRFGALLSSAVVTVLLGAAGVSMLTAGVLAVAYGLVGPFLPPAWGELVLRLGLPQLVFVAVGGIVAVVGIIVIRVLMLNLSVLSKALLKSNE